MLSSDDLILVASLCRKRAGLKIDHAKAYQIETRLAPLARREGAASSAEVIERVRGGDDRLAWLTVEAMAFGETSFFRDALPFEQFETDLLPRLAKARGAAPVRVWSAACGGGQEAYSLAMAAASLPSVNLELFGSDISETALRRAQSGLYSQFEIQRGLPARMLVKHFEKSGDAWRVVEPLRRQMRWRRVNLIDDLSSLPMFDIIFCRNVLTLLDGPYQAQVLNSLSKHLAPDGVLVLGLKETAQAAHEAFSPIEGRPGLYSPGGARRAA